MKVRLSLALLLVSSVAVANQQVEVTGTGSSVPDAREDAIQLALMKACKSAVVSNKEFRNRTSQRSKVLVYNGCLVKNYTILDEWTEDNLIKVSIKAEVIKNHLPDRIIGQNPDWFFYDFNQHNDRVAQLKTRMTNAKGLVNEIFFDYPQSAFYLERTDYTIDYTNARGYLNVSYRLLWNPNFINALEDTFDVLKDKSKSAWDSNEHTIQIRRKYVFTTFNIPSQTFITMSQRRPHIRIRIIDSSEVTHFDVCYQPRQWYNMWEMSNNTLIFRTKGIDRGDISVRIPDNLPNDAEVTMDVVPDSFCKQFL